jgi:hypothetical protein
MMQNQSATISLKAQKNLQLAKTTADAQERLQGSEPRGSTAVIDDALRRVRFTFSSGSSPRSSRLLLLPEPDSLGLQVRWDPSAALSPWRAASMQWCRSASLRSSPGFREMTIGDDYLPVGAVGIHRVNVVAAQLEKE